MKQISSSLRSRRTILLQLALIIGVAISAIAFQSYAAGTFNQPSVGAPGGNAYAPLNVGINSQTKLGGLTLHTNSVTTKDPYGLIVANGNVGIGTTNPTSKLDVNGTVEVAQNIGTGGFSPTAGIPTGWGGGVHTWDVYAEGTVGVGKNGQINAYLNNAGNIWAKNSISAPSIGTNSITLNGVKKTSWTAALKPQIFSYTGKVKNYAVPAGVSSVKLDVLGAQGSNYTLGLGGYGGYATGLLTVHAGEILHIYVGGQKGWNGGGNSGGWWGGVVTNGGGASDVRIGGYRLNNRVIVAGGGGGYGGYGSYGYDGAGGAGGGYIGSSGIPSDYGGVGGGGGTQTKGGGSGGTYGFGGHGSGYGGVGGGGGGGGYYGGGGGRYTGGGGGSSYVGKVNGGMTISGINMGNGEIIVTPY